MRKRDSVTRRAPSKDCLPDVHVTGQAFHQRVENNPVAPHVALHLETCIVMHEDLRDVRRYRVVFDALVEGLSRHVDVT